ncbi:TVP38/TMEM64 family protein [Candidatus Puniceispirillum marinum]|uniref:TVP38/TMEM64 family membrane protein n=1 Tax=Puniceispirillum marinum (strain IMCC1322) TaxID=488538 RepID=D5BTG9_PUNMI|nr:VTT domain-containing protein [Candidatus Puniceispirillum marinum]ADE39566.1 SNARE associated Golgi protein-like protein [Candidatus Puniceispirillum marinum IMCC1322]
MAFIRKYALPVTLVSGLILFFVTGTHKLVSWETISNNYSLLKQFANDQVLTSYAMFLLLYVIVVAFSLPIALPLTLTGGALLGWPAGIVIIFAATMGAGIVFMAARTVFSDVLRDKAGPFIARLESGFNENAFNYLLALRLIPAAPFWVVNIIPGLTKMKLSSFLLATFIGIIPGTMVFVSVGRGFDTILASGQTPDLSVLSSPSILIALGGLGALALMPVIYKRVTQSRKASETK